MLQHLPFPLIVSRRILSAVAMAPTMSLPHLLRQQVSGLLNLLCLLLTLLWALFLRRPIRATFATMGCILEELGAADAVDVV
ncbi:hypothetical protein MGN70_006907 [Eutypa lata]|nr:hypothetical protein MGN70_006907 [Eutypa lata]